MDDTIRTILAILGLALFGGAALWLVALMCWLACRTIARSLQRALGGLAALRRTRADMAHIRECEALWRVIHREYPPGRGWQPPALGGYQPDPPEDPRGAA